MDEATEKQLRATIYDLQTKVAQLELGLSRVAAELANLSIEHTGYDTRLAFRSSGSRVDLQEMAMDLERVAA